MKESLEKIKEKTKEELKREEELMSLCDTLRKVYSGYQDCTNQISPSIAGILY